VIDHRGKSNT